MKQIEIFTDGSCLGNPGPGGYGAVLIFSEHRKELSQGFKHTTNNRMELLATIEALACLTERCKINLTTDSQYVKNGIGNVLMSKLLDTMLCGIGSKAIQAILKMKPVINWHEQQQRVKIN